MGICGSNTVKDVRQLRIEKRRANKRESMFINPEDSKLKGKIASNINSVNIQKAGLSIDREYVKEIKSELKSAYEDSSGSNNFTKKNYMLNDKVMKKALEDIHEEQDPEELDMNLRLKGELERNDYGPNDFFEKGGENNNVLKTPKIIKFNDAISIDKSSHDNLNEVNIEGNQKLNNLTPRGKNQKRGSRRSIFNLEEELQRVNKIDPSTTGVSTKNLVNVHHFDSKKHLDNLNNQIDNKINENKVNKIGGDTGDDFLDEMKHIEDQIQDEIEAFKELQINRIDFETMREHIVADEKTKKIIIEMYNYVNQTPAIQEQTGDEKDTEISDGMLEMGNGQKKFTLEADLDQVIDEIVTYVKKPEFNFGGAQILKVFISYYWIFNYYRSLACRRTISASRLFYAVMDNLDINCEVVKGLYRPWYRYYEEVDLDVRRNTEWNVLEINGVECFISFEIAFSNPKISEENQIKISFLPPSELFRQFHFPKTFIPQSLNAIVDKKHFKFAPKIVNEQGISNLMLPINWDEVINKSEESKQFKQLRCYLEESGIYRIDLISVTNEFNRNQIDHMPQIKTEKGKKTFDFDIYIPGDGDYLQRGQKKNYENNRWVNLWEFRLTCLKSISKVASPNYGIGFFEKEATWILPKTKFIPANRSIIFRITMKDVILIRIHQKRGEKEYMYPVKDKKDTYECELFTKPGKVIVKFSDKKQYIWTTAVEFEAVENVIGLDHLDEGMIKFADTQDHMSNKKTREIQNTDYSHRRLISQFINQLWNKAWNTVPAEASKIVTMQELVTYIKTAAEEKLQELTQNPEIIELFNNKSGDDDFQEITQVFQTYLWVTHCIKRSQDCHISIASEKVKIRKAFPDPNEILNTKVTNYNGYTSLFQDVMQKLNIQCHFEQGYCKKCLYDINHSMDKTNHSWNLVFLCNQWYFVDTFHGSFLNKASEANNGQNPNYQPYSHNRFYFCTRPEEAIHMNYSQGEKWMLSEKVFPKEDFKKEKIYGELLFNLDIKVDDSCLANGLHRSYGGQIMIPFTCPYALDFNIEIKFEEESYKDSYWVSRNNNDYKILISFPKDGIFEVIITAKEGYDTSQPWYNFMEFKAQIENCQQHPEFPIIHRPFFTKGCNQFFPLVRKLIASVYNVKIKISDTNNKPVILLKEKGVDCSHSHTHLTEIKDQNLPVKNESAVNQEQKPIVDQEQKPVVNHEQKPLQEAEQFIHEELFSYLGEDIWEITISTKGQKSLIIKNDDETQVKFDVECK